MHTKGGLSLLKKDFSMLTINCAYSLFHLLVLLKFQDDFFVIPLGLDILLLIEYLINGIRIEYLSDHIKEEIW
jgi:hypothetical protein